MKHVNRDFQAFRLKLAAAAVASTLGAYEKRETSDATPDLGKLAGTLDKIAGAFAEYRTKQDERMDWLETRLSRPGATTSAGDAPNPQAPDLIDTETGRPVVSIEAGDNIAVKLAQAGLFAPEELRAVRAESPQERLSLGDYLRAVMGQRASPLAVKALSIGTDSAGGYTVPSVLMPGILEAFVANSSLMQAGAKMIPVDVSAGAKTYTFAAVNAVPTAAWRSEAGAVSETDPTFRAVVATPRSLAFFFKVSRELLADAVNLDTTLNGVIGQAMAVALDKAGLFGSGTAPEPRGIKNTSGIQAVTNGANGASLATLRWANLMTATQALLDANAPMPAAAIMAPRSLIGFGSLADTTNQPLQRPDTLRNLRMLTSSQIATNITTGTSTDTTDIYLGEFSRCGFVMRETISILRANELYAGTGQVAFFAHVRGDFIVEYPSAFALISGVRP
jgi:HK97 family phage major capsid protein